jgi:hypothetical protein
MSSRRVVVVDGSNIATEGRSQPSLIQLDEAVRAYREERPDDEIIVVVDATFAHRIDEAERPMFEDAAAHNELVYPPAGAVGRGDAFLLRIAEKTNAVVLSNDSFQEFHGEHDWLFDKGRLIGGTPVPGVGWIFVARTPVRGPKSREAVKEARRTKARVGSKEASAPMPVPKTPPPRGGGATKKAAAGGGAGRRPAAGGGGRRGRVLAADVDVDAEVDEAIAEATEEVVHPDDFDAAGDGGGSGRGRGKRRRKRRGSGVGGGEGDGNGNGNGVGGGGGLPTLNEPLTFIEFIAAHKLGSQVEGVVESFASHGAFVEIDEARCYIPLSAMGEPPPRSAREVLRKGEARAFVVQALDAARRGIELALPGFEQVSGTPTEETVEAEIAEAPRLAASRSARTGAAKKTTGRKAAAKAAKAKATTKTAKAAKGTTKAAKGTTKKGAAAAGRRTTRSPAAVPPAADPVPIVTEVQHVTPLGWSEQRIALETTPASSLTPRTRTSAKASAKKATKAATKKATKAARNAGTTTAAPTKAGSKRAAATKAGTARKAATQRGTTTPAVTTETAAPANVGAKKAATKARPTKAAATPRGTATPAVTTKTAAPTNVGAKKAAAKARPTKTAASPATAATKSAAAVPSTSAAAKKTTKAKATAATKAPIKTSAVKGAKKSAKKKTSR